MGQANLLFLKVTKFTCPPLSRRMFSVPTFHPGSGQCTIAQALLADSLCTNRGCYLFIFFQLHEMSLSHPGNSKLHQKKPLCDWIFSFMEHFWMTDEMSSRKLGRFWMCHVCLKDGLEQEVKTQTFEVLESFNMSDMVQLVLQSMQGLM